MYIAGLSVLFLIIIILEAPRLIKGKMWKELVVFSLLLLLGAGLSFALLMDWPIPNPTNIMERLFEPFNMWFEKILS